MTKPKQPPNQNKGANIFDPLRDYLEYYKNLDSPGFAVLVTGEWGCGKTYQVLNLLPERQRYYLSLFELTSKDEIYASLLAQMYPADAKAKKEAEFFKRNNMWFGLPAGAVFGAIINRSVKTEIDRTRTIVLDDLERSSIPLPTLLGTINSLVEHEGCKVVVIAHDTEIEKQFAVSKEKIFGQTVRVEPQAGSAFDHFVSKFNAPIKSLVTQYKSQILDTFALSQCKSLRVLKYVTAITGRFLLLLTQEQLGKNDAVAKLVLLLVANAIEVNRGDLVRSELSNRIRSYTLAGMKSPQNDPTIDSEHKERLKKFAVSNERYQPLVELSGLELNDQLLVDMLIDGKFDKASLQKQLEHVEHFNDDDNLPAWKKFFKFTSLPNDDCSELMKIMDRQFMNCEIVELGELLHIWSFRILRVREGLLESDLEKEFSSLKEYFDSLVKRKKFPTNVDRGLFINHASYGGNVFWEAEKNSELLSRAYDHAKICERSAILSKFPSVKEEILSLMQTAPQDLVSLLCYDGQEPGKYFDIPALTSFGAIEFVDELLRLPNQNKQKIARALTIRRRYINSSDRFIDEVNWFDEVKSELQRRSDSAIGLDRIRISSLIPR